MTLLAGLSALLGSHAMAQQPADSAAPTAAVAAEAPATGAATAPAEGAATGPAASEPASSAPATRTSAVQLREHVERTEGLWTYITLFVILVLSGLGLPVPEEVPLLLAGYLARDHANLWGLIAVGLLGALSADVILFMAAHRWRSHIFRWRWMRAMIRPRHLVLARRQFHNHGLKIVIVARWLPALRSAVCLTAGLTGVKFWRFLLVDATAASITVPTSILLGYYMAQHIDRVIAGFVKVEHFVLVGVLTAVAVAVLVRFVWWHRSSRQARLAKPLPPTPHDGHVGSTEKITGKPGHGPAKRSEVG